jgi:outer membrane immunogenic protein
MRILTAAVLLAAVSAAPAYAQDTAGRFTGGHVEIIGGLDINQFQIDEDDLEDPNDDDDRSARSALYGVSGGFDFSTSTGLLFGVEAEVTRSTLDLCEDLLCIENVYTLYGGGRAGMVVGERALIYAKAGYARTRLRVEEEGEDGETLDKESLDGIRIGIGGEGNVGGAFLGKLEYRYTNYEADVSSHQVVVGLGMRF